MRKAQIVVTLTSIPPRFSNLPRKLASIHKQTVRPDRVELTLPQVYRRFPGEKPALPPLPDWLHVIETADDLGPATKVLPAALRWKGTRTDLLLCDDDRLQDKNWIARFETARASRPLDILCERGWNIQDRFGIATSSPALPRAVLDPRHGRTLRYRLARLASLTLYHPKRQIYSAAGYADVFEGFLGSMIPVDSFPSAAFNIPDVIWTVDDVWLSGMAHLKGINVWVTALPRPIYSDGHYDKVAALRDHVEKGIEREGADRMAVQYLQKSFGIWT